MDQYLAELLATLAYSGAGVTLMALGYILVDIVTPGRLSELIWVDRNRNASLLLASNLAGVGLIVVSAILSSADDFVAGIISTGVYGVLGLVVMAVAFLLLDLATPGRLGEILVDPQPHPAVWVSAVVHFATGAVIAASIT